MGDFDNDGWLDLAVVNGRVRGEKVPRHKPELSPHWEPFGEYNQLFANVEGKKFRDVSSGNPAFCGYATVARGLACGDLTGDGGLDLLVNSIGEKARLFKNVAPGRGNWIAVRAVDPSLNRDALGAEVTACTGKVQRLRLIGGASSYLSAGPLSAHFGLGCAEAVDAFEVVWWDGTRERFPGSRANVTVELKKGSGSR